MTTEVVRVEEALAPEPGPRGNDWRVLLGVFMLAGVVESQAFGHLGAFTPLYLQQLGVARVQIPQWTGILQSLAFVIGLPLLPFWGIWAERYGRKIIIIRSAYVEGVLFTVAALAPNIWVLAVARFLAGFVFGNTGVMLALLADRTPRRRLGLAVGIASAGFPLGSAIGPLFGGLIAQGPGIRTLLLLDAALSAVMGVVLTLVVRDEQHRRVTDKSAGQLMRTALNDILASPVVTRLFALYFAAMFGISLTTPFIPILLQRLYTGPAAQVAGVIGVSLTVAGLAMAVTTPLWGRLGDLVGRWRVLPICVGAVALGVLGEAVAGSLLPMQGTIAWIGLFQGGIGTTVLALLALLASEERRTTVLNFALVPSQLSWFAGPLLGALLAAVTLRLPFFVGATVLGVALALAVVVGRQAARLTGAAGAAGNVA